MTIGISGISGIVNEATGFVKENVGLIAIGTGVAGIAAGVGLAAAIGSSGPKKTRKRSSHTKRGWKQDRKRFNKRQKWEVDYRKRKKSKSKHHKSRGGIHYTKNGQPYKILSSGKARFIKKTKRRSR